MLKTIFPAIVLSTFIILSCNNHPKKEQPVTKEDKSQLEEMLSKHPDSFALKEQLIDYYQANENTTAAIDQTKKMLGKDSTDDKLWYKAANLYSDKDDTVNTIYALRKAWSLKRNPKYLKELGYIYAVQGNPLALEASDGLFSVSSGTLQEQALFIKGVYYSTAGDKNKAISIFDQCLAMDYNDMFSYREKAICLYDLAKYNDALDVLQKAVTVKSSFDEAYYWMGRCYEKLGKRDDAIQSYQTAVQLDSAYIEAQDALDALTGKHH